MSSIVTDQVDFAERLLVEAKRDLDLSQLENAVCSARLAWECFEVARGIPECEAKIIQGVAEAKQIIEIANRRGGSALLNEAVNHRLAVIDKEVDELMRDSRRAVRAALTVD